MLDFFSNWQEKLVPVSVDSIKDDHASLTTKQGGQSFLWPKEQLPSNVKDGDTIFLRAFSKEELSSFQADIIRNVVSQLMN